MTHQSPGNLLRRHRKAAGLTLKDLAAQTSYTFSVISRIERDQYLPTDDYLTEMIAALKLSADDTQQLRAAYVAARRARSERVPTNLPARLPTLLGRDDARATLVQRVPEAALVTLTGPGGSGKTLLAQTVARDLLAQFPDGVFFVGLESITDPSLVLPAVLNVLGIAGEEEQTSLEVLVEHLGEQRLLLLLDNLEQVAAVAPLLADLLAAVPGLTVLATSRVPLRLAVEHVVTVPPLALPDLAALPDLDTLRTIPAVALFVARAQQTAPHFTLGTHTMTAVAELCTRLDGLPLALELAAARIALLTPHELLQRLTPDLLSGIRHDRPPRQQTIEHTIGWSYALLGPEEQRLFACLGVFVGGWTLDAAETVCVSAVNRDVQVISGLTALVEHHLVQRSDTAEGTDSRFSMLELVRAQAAARLAELPDQHAIQERHARFFLHLAEAGDLLLADVTAPEWGARLAGEEGNLRRALTWAFAQDDPTLALRLTSALTPFWHVRHMQYEGRRWTEQALARCTAASPELQARVIFAAGDMARDQGDYTQARTHFERSLKLWQAIEHQRGTALTLQRSAFCLHNQGDYAEAERVYRESLHWWRQPDLMYDPGLPHVLTSLGRLLLEQGQLDQAQTILLDALQHYQQQQHLRGIALVQGHLGMAALCQGDFDAACDHCERSRMLLARLGQESAFELSVLGMAEMLRGNSAAAQQVLQAALRLRGTQGDKGNLPYCLEGLAGVALAQGDPLRAATLGGAAEGLRAASRAPFPAAARHLYNQYQTMMQAALPPAHVNTAWTTGRAMKVSQAVAYALADASS